MWRQCRLLYRKVRREGRNRERPQTKPQLAGILFHSTCEAAYHAVKGSSGDDRVVEIGTLEKLLDEVIAEREARDKERAVKDAEKDAKAAPKKGRKPKPKPSVHADLREIVLDLLASIAPLDLTRTVQVETPWSLQTAHGEIVGVFDRVDELIDVQTGEVAGLEVVDYKTGGYVVSDYDLPHDVQAQLYLLAAREKFPEARRISLRMYWCARDEWSAPVLWGKAYDEAARRRIEADLEEIRRAAAWRKPPGDEPVECGHGNASHSCAICTSDPAEKEAAQACLRDPYPPTLSTSCSDCAFKFECPAYRDEVRRATDPAVVQKLETLDPSDLRTPVLLRTRQKLQIAEKIFEGLRRAYDAEIKDRIPEGEYSITSADLTARLASRGSYSMMPEDDLVQFVMPILEPGINPDAEVTVTERERWLASIASLDKKKLAAALSSLPKETAKAVGKTMKERRVRNGEATWIEVNEVESPI